RGRSGAAWKNAGTVRGAGEAVGIGAPCYRGVIPSAQTGRDGANTRLDSDAGVRAAALVLGFLLLAAVEILWLLGAGAVRARPGSEPSGGASTSEGPLPAGEARLAARARAISTDPEGSQIRGIVLDEGGRPLTGAGVFVM